MTPEERAESIVAGTNYPAPYRETVDHNGRAHREPIYPEPFWNLALEKSIAQALRDARNEALEDAAAVIRGYNEISNTHAVAEKILALKTQAKP